MSEWEYVCSGTYRINVEGGWVYRYGGVTICFVPSPSTLPTMREQMQGAIIDVESKDVPDHVVNGNKVETLKEKI